MQKLENAIAGLQPISAPASLQTLQPSTPSCCSPQAPAQINNIQIDSNYPADTPWIAGTIKTIVSEINVVKTKLEFSDRLGGCKVRWGMGRMSYIISPGLYAVGSPSDKSPVFVTANFKLSFDHLRSELTGINGWILVLDTKGINVWCAAGKGTFGTDELVHRIRETQLEKVISHRRLILPQLGAPGVA
ncbi:MAG: acetyl-CoA synthase subunit gamma, partial [FCB group bacterium]|nr:acetyl-CoA synthase subunit gamma [FCB group bacterium]